MEQTIAPLSKGDLIAIVAPAKSIEASHVYFAQSFFENAGYQVVIGPHCLGQYHYFSGSEEERLRDFQWALDHPDVKAIVCARGGYGCIQLVDRINWAGQLSQPKWIVGFSDITVFHQRMQRFGVESIHASMPLNFESNSNEALETLLHSFSGKQAEITWEANSFNKVGTCSGVIVGGNLSILYSLLGTDDQVDYTNKIVFIEDLAEQIYHIDRMFYAFAKSGILDKISGLIIGGMTDLKDTAIPFGRTYEEVILSHFSFRKIPISFGFPAGHIDDNRAIIFGRTSTLEVTENGCSLR